MAQDTRT